MIKDKREDECLRTVGRILRICLRTCKEGDGRKKYVRDDLRKKFRQGYEREKYV